MCTMIVKQTKMEGSGKGADGWFMVKGANVSYDHPVYAPYEHALNIDFVDESKGPSARVAVELSVESARKLMDIIQEVLAQAQDGGYLAK